MAGFHAFLRQRHRAVQPAFVQAVGQQPAGVKAFFKHVDGPGEMHLAVHGGEVVGIFVRANKRKARRVAGEAVEIRHLVVGRAAADDDFHRALAAADQFAQHGQAFAAANGTKPANNPRRPGLAVTGGHGWFEREHLVFN
ncbi:MAG: hypothetical protein EBV03_01845 [Proteobacteria bacterium]|nr:hypothetical protein [Pseudomonadota bacterium]